MWNKSWRRRALSPDRLSPTRFRSSRSLQEWATWKNHERFRFHRRMQKSSSCGTSLMFGRSSGGFVREKGEEAVYNLPFRHLVLFGVERYGASHHGSESRPEGNLRTAEGSYGQGR